jgi:TatD DNase family protein
MGMRFIDSHLHLADFPDSAQPLRFARSSGTLLMTAGIDRGSSLEGLSHSRSYPSLVRAFVGVHPSEAKKENLNGWFEEALHEASGAGEIGLDPKYSQVKGVQESLFRAQLELAEKLEKPVQVHSRGAETECLEILGSSRIIGVLLHWFQGEDKVAFACDRGYFVSFGPALVVSKKLQRMASAWEREKILVESDGPVPFSALGGARGPTLIPSVIFKLSDLFRWSFEETEELLIENSLRYLPRNLNLPNSSG